VEKRRTNRGEEYVRYSAEEERALVNAWRAGDQAAARKLIDGVQYLVRGMAQRYMRFGVELEDLISEGLAGVAHALRKFEPDRGLRFMTYAHHWVKAYMLKFAVGHQEFSSRGRKFFFESSRELAIALRLNPLAPVDEVYAAVAARFQVGVDELGPRKLMSLNEKLRRGGGSLYAAEDEYIDFLPSETPNPHDDAEARVDRAASIALRALYLNSARNYRDKLILEQRLLADPDDKLSLEEIGDRLGITRERVRQLEAKLKDRIKLAVEREQARELAASRVCPGRALEQAHTPRS
jgi:RNA polymerase sigma-32 factor